MIYIIPDTNYIKLSHNEKADYTKFYLNKNFDVLFQLQNKKAIESDITIAIPEIVLKELQQQKREAYDEICKKVKMLFHCLGDYGKGEIFVTTEQYDKILDEQIKAFINSNNLIVVPICKKEWFQSIIKRAINKKAPFEGEKSKSDKGFKDVIIWYSLLDYAKEKEGEYIFITNDGAFYKDLEELKREFKEKTGKDIFIYKNYDDVLQHIVIKESEIYIDSVSINYDVREILLKHSESDYSAKLKYIQPRIFTEKEVLSFINIDIKNIYDDALERWNSIDLSRSEFNSNSYMGSMQYCKW